MQTFKHSLESSAHDPACSLKQRVQNFVLSYKSTIHAATRPFSAKLFLHSELRTRLSLERPDFTTHVSCQQGKMKLHQDKNAKFTPIAVGDTFLSRDLSSGQVWQPGTIEEHRSSHSHRVRLWWWASFAPSNNGELQKKNRYRILYWVYFGECRYTKYKTPNKNCCRCCIYLLAEKRPSSSCSFDIRRW